MQPLGIIHSALQFINRKLHECSLGLVVIGSSIVNFLKRAASWIIHPSGITALADRVGRENLPKAETSKKNQVFPAKQPLSELTQLSQQELNNTPYNFNIDALDEEGSDRQKLSKLLALPPAAEMTLKIDSKNTGGEVSVVYKNINITAVNKDLFYLGTEAVVNAANDRLARGTGVCGDVEKYCGLAVFEQCEEYLKANKISRIQTGHAMITSTQDFENLKFVIHSVGPQGRADNDKINQLYSAYYNALMLAHKNKITSIAFPSISTGIYGFPIQFAAPTALHAIRQFIDRHQDTSIKEIKIAAFNSKKANAFDFFEHEINLMIPN